MKWPYDGHQDFCKQSGKQTHNMQTLYYVVVKYGLHVITMCTSCRPLFCLCRTPVVRASKWINVAESKRRVNHIRALWACFEQRNGDDEHVVKTIGLLAPDRFTDAVQREQRRRTVRSVFEVCLHHPHEYDQTSLTDQTPNRHDLPNKTYSRFLFCPQKKRIRVTASITCSVVDDSNNNNNNNVVCHVNNNIIIFSVFIIQNRW